MVETVVALLLFLNGNMVEHVYKDSLKVCNESKKIAEKVVNPLNVTFVCKEIKAKTEIDSDTKQKRIVKVFDNNIFTGSGSGFFISDEGHLVTNYHVVNYCNINQVNYSGKTS